MTDRNARRRYARALEEVYARSDDYARTYGASWYSDAADIARDIARTHPCKPSQAAGCIAAISPQTPWQENVRSARELADWTFYASRETGSEDFWHVCSRLAGYNKQLAKAVRCLTGDPNTILNGPKERAFWLNIIGATDHVTVDVWATRAATRGALSVPGSRYGDIAAAYRTVARRVGMTPRDLQACVWITVRGSAD